MYVCSARRPRTGKRRLPRVRRVFRFDFRSYWGKGEGGGGVWMDDYRQNSRILRVAFSLVLRRICQNLERRRYTNVDLTAKPIAGTKHRNHFCERAPSETHTINSGVISRVSHSFPRSRRRTPYVLLACLVGRLLVCCLRFWLSSPSSERVGCALCRRRSLPVFPPPVTHVRARRVLPR